MTVYVVPCSQTKSARLQREPLPSRDAYAGQAFRMARAVLDRRGLPWFILSAKYGFLHPSTPIAYYDVKMATLPAAFQLLDDRHVHQLAGAARVVCLGSRLYATAAETLLGRTVEAPLAGMAIGWMLQALKLEHWANQQTHSTV